MSLLSTQPLLSILALVTVASITQFIIYSVFRLLERKSQVLSAALTVAILAFWALTNAAAQQIIGVDFFVYIVPLIGLTSTFGGIIHRKSGGASESLTYAFLMMFVVSLSAVLIGAPVFQLFDPNFLVPTFRAYNNNPKYFAWALIMIQLIAPPILYWVVRSSRLQAGVDKHFDA